VIFLTNYTVTRCSKRKHTAILSSYLTAYIFDFKKLKQMKKIFIELPRHIISKTVI